MSGLQRNRARPAAPDMYAKRAADAESVRHADLVPPATSYAGVKSGLSTPGFATPTLRPKFRAAFVDHHWRLNGIRNFWSWGGTDMGRRVVSLPGPGGDTLVPSVRSTLFQPVNVLLHWWTQNDRWYIAWNGTGSGMFNGSKEVRYQYPSFRTPQLNTRTTGGPGPVGMQMQPRPRFTAVQKIRKYTATPRYYNTRSGNGNYMGTGKGASNGNGPGVS